MGTDEVKKRLCFPWGSTASIPGSHPSDLAERVDTLSNGIRHAATHHP